MLLELVISLITLACIIAFVVWLAMQPQKRILQIAVPVCVIGFMIIYAFYLVARLVPGDPVFGIPAAFSAFVETFGSFTNGVAYSDVAESGRVMNVFGVFWFETLFWSLHMLVIISIAISGFAVFGRKFMDKVRLRLYRGLRGRDIYFIFGDSAEAILLGKNIAEKYRGALIVFFSLDYTVELRERIADFGGALIEVSAKTRAEYIAMAEEKRKENVAKFEGFVRPKVNDCAIADLLARYVVRKNPPYRSMDVEHGADVDYLDRIPRRPYASIVIGFGELGRACLRQLIMASQFTLNGSRPKFCVIDRNGISFDRFCIENPGIGECADITFVQADVFSFEAQCAIDAATCDNQAPLRQVYICCAPVVASNPQERAARIELNGEICSYVEGLIAYCDCTENVRGGSSRVEFINPCVEEVKIWTPEIVLHKELDRRGIYVSAKYDGLKTPSKDLSELFRKSAEEWNDPKAKPELHRDSSRATAAFMEAYFGLVGIDCLGFEGVHEAETMLERRPDVLEALARIEHNRWNAFHYCNGYTPMSVEELKARIEEGERVARGEKTAESAESGERFKANQDYRKKKHACLVPWEVLPALDELMGQSKGDYQEYDRSNVRTACNYLKNNL